MAFCPYCGTQVEDGSKFCIACGAKLDIAAPAPAPAPEPVTEQPQQTAYQAPQQTYQQPQQSYQQSQQGYQQPQQGYQQPQQGYQQGYVPPAYPNYQPQNGGKATGKKKSKLPLIIGIVLGVIILGVIGLVVLGGMSRGGTVYNCTGVSMSGLTMTSEEVFDGPSTLTLKDNGKGQIDLGGTKSGVKWTQNGEQLEVIIEGETSTGTLKDGVITLDLNGTGLIATFVQEGVTVPENNSNGKTEPEPSPAPVPAPAPATDASEAGYYKFSTGNVDASELGFDGLDLKPDGTGAFVMSGIGLPIVWSEGKISFAGTDVSAEDEAIPFTVSGDTLTISYGDDYLDFGRDPAGAPEYTLLDEEFFGEIDPDPLTALQQEWWAGDWYGWWIILDSEGYWADYDGDWWDCAAKISFDEDDEVLLEIWDEDGSYDEGLMLMIYAILGEGSTDAGSLTCDQGMFWDYELGYADVIIDPGESVVSDFDHMIEITGHYIDPENDGSFDFAIYLRPWGMDWEDVREYDENDLPYAYDEWYLPLIRKGDPMPNVIE